MSLKRATINKIVKTGPGPFETPDPFLFCVYHKDTYPAGNKVTLIYIYNSKPPHWSLSYEESTIV